MPDRKRTTILLASLLLSLAACGGNASTGSAPTPGPTQATATDSPSTAATEGPDATPAETTSGGGGGGGDACELVTAEEAGTILGVNGVTTELTPGDFSYCIYRDAAGDATGASSYTARGGAAIFGVWKSGAGVQDIDGIGDDAVFDPSSATLFVSKGDAVFGISAGISSDSEAQRLEWAKEFGAIAAGRM